MELNNNWTIQSLSTQFKMNIAYFSCQGLRISPYGGIGLLKKNRDSQ